MGLHNNGSNESQGRVVKLHHRQIDIQIPHPSKGREAMATSAKGVGSLPRREKQGRTKSERILGMPLAARKGRRPCLDTAGREQQWSAAQQKGAMLIGVRELPLALPAHLLPTLQLDHLCSGAW